MENKPKRIRGFKGSIEKRMVEEDLARCPSCYKTVSADTFLKDEVCAKCGDIMYMMEYRKCHRCEKLFMRKTGYNMWFCTPCKLTWSNISQY